jgi:hypothetical protein
VERTLGARGLDPLLLAALAVGAFVTSITQVGLLLIKLLATFDASVHGVFFFHLFSLESE